MNSEIRRLFMITVGLFAILAVAMTTIQFFQAPSLTADPRNARRYLQAAERDRGAIIIGDSPAALSTRVEGTNTFQREYPDGALYAPVTGYFSAVNMSATGMEAAANETLEGNTSDLLWQRLRNLFAGRPREGGGVWLTIDEQMQTLAAELLGDRAGAVVALDAKTGAVLTLYSSPSFDPNPLASLDSSVAAEAAEKLEEDPSKPLENRAIASNRYAPGSTFKILTTIALLEQGLTPGSEVEAPVSTKLPGTDVEISNVNDSTCGDGSPTLEEAFARSCNTAFVLATEEYLDVDILSEVASRFGFGESLQIPLSVTPSTFPKDMDSAQLAMSAIGQFDVQVTPLQMAMVAQAIANEGTMMAPYMIQATVDADNQVTSESTPQELGNPVSAQVAKEIKEMMISAVNESYGTGRSAAVSGIQVAAKTGTAEVGDGSRTNAWTVAFAPADDPEIAIAVIVEGDEDNPIVFGGSVAAPIVSQLLEVGLR